MKTGDQADSGADEDTPHDERAQNAPEQNAMLQVFGDREIIEDHEEEEKVIDAERKLQDITGYEFEPRLGSLPEVQDGGKDGGQRNVHGTQAQRPAKSHNVAGAVEDAKIQHQHTEREKVEQNPEIEQWTMTLDQNL